MKQFLMATALIVVAVGAFFGGRVVLMPAAPAAVAVNPLGELSALAASVTDVQDIARSGDLEGAKARINDLETAWDDAQPTLQPKDPEAWGRVDDAADGALTALRAATPDAADVEATLAALQVALVNPGPSGAGESGGVQMISGVAVTDAAGHPLPCEAMLKDIEAKRSVVRLTPEAAAKIDDLIAKATERCNADDDKTANSFSAQALQALSGN